MNGLKILALASLIGCGATLTPVVVQEKTKPGLRWSPMIGVVLEATDEKGVYRVTVNCRAWIEFNTQTVSDVDEECHETDYTGQAMLLVSRDQIQEMYDYWRKYY